MPSVHSCIRLKRNNGGFTLIELMIAVAVSAIVLMAVVQFFISTNRTSTVLEKTAATQQTIRMVMEMISRDLRLAGLNPTGNAACAGFTDFREGTGDTSVALAYDYYDAGGNPNSSGDCSNNRENLCYAFDQGNGRVMLRWSNDGGNNWHSYSMTEEGIIESLNFEYFESIEKLENDEPIADPAGSLDDIRVVRITICGTITGAYSEDLKNPYCFSGTIRPRNL